MCSGCDVENMSSLKDISKPYVGEYKCRKLQLGEEDELKKFESVKLNFAPEGTFTLTAVDLMGNESAYDGEYEFAENGVYLYANSGAKTERYLFPYEKGAVQMNLLFHEKLLQAQFTMVE